MLHAETFELPRYFSKGQTDQLIQELATAKTSLRHQLSDHVHKILGPYANDLDLTFEVIDTFAVQAVLVCTGLFNLNSLES